MVKLTQLIHHEEIDNKDILCALYITRKIISSRLFLVLTINLQRE